MVVVEVDLNKDLLFRIISVKSIIPLLYCIDGNGFIDQRLTGLRFYYYYVVQISYYTAYNITFYG